MIRRAGGRKNNGRARTTADSPRKSCPRTSAIMPCLRISYPQPTGSQHACDRRAEVCTTRPEPAVPMNRSMRADYLTCLHCGKHLSMLKRHLRMDHQLTPQQYRQRWGLSVSYPMVASGYAKVRSAIAKKIGLGRVRSGPSASR